MEIPPALPPAQPPLGPAFYALLLTPAVFIVLTCCFANTAKIGGQLLALTALVTFVCSIILAVQLGRRLGKTDGGRVGMGILMFIALQAFYGGCFFIGCMAAISLS